MKIKTDKPEFKKIRPGEALRSRLQVMSRVPRRWQSSRGLVALALFFALLPGISQLVAGVLKIQLPPETASFKPTPGSVNANAQCLTCHSVDYVLTQPPFPRIFWAAEVKKMRDKFGAPIPEDQIEPLVNYLVINYGTGASGQPTAAAGTDLMAALTNLPPLSVEALATRYGCLSCHKVNVKVVGPAFKDVAAKYRNDPAAFDKISLQIHHGGSGKWGSAVMPPFTVVNDAEAQMLAKWIMSQDASEH